MASSLVAECGNDSKTLKKREASGCWNAKNCVFFAGCIVAITATFGLLGLLVHWVNLSQGLKCLFFFEIQTEHALIFVANKSVTRPEVRERDDSRCSANSFMIGDGVCDEATNTEECLFDGNDCCLENKNTDLCQDCFCRLEREHYSHGCSTLSNRFMSLSVCLRTTR